MTVVTSLERELFDNKLRVLKRSSYSCLWAWANSKACSKSAFNSPTTNWKAKGLSLLTRLLTSSKTAKPKGISVTSYLPVKASAYAICHIQFFANKTIWEALRLRKESENWVGLRERSTFTMNYDSFGNQL